MREFIERQYNCTFIRFADFDGEHEMFECIVNGELILADSLALMLSELQSRTHRAMLLAA